MIDCISVEDIESYEYIELNEVHDLTIEENHNYFLDCGKPILVHNSGKTWGIIDYLLDYARENKLKNKKITIGRETYRECMETVADDFFKRLKQIGWYYNKFHKESHPQSYWLLGNTVDFTGWYNSGQPSKRQDVLWMNEAMENDEETFKQYNQRTNELVFLDYNPKVTEHWIYRTVCNRPDAYFSHWTQLQNEFLPDKQRKEILAYEPTAENIKNGTADDFMWSVYGLGLRTAAKGLIFKRVNYIDKWPDEITDYEYGLDFGFTNSPSALSKTALKNNDLFGECLLYEPIDNANDMSDYFEKIGIPKHIRITADSADKYNDVEMVKDLKDLGWNIVKVNKGKGVNWRIGNMKKHKLNIVSGTNAKREFQNYKWKEIHGVLINEPVDAFNHFIDALGYGYLSITGGGIVYNKNFF